MTGNKNRLNRLIAGYERSQRQPLNKVDAVMGMAIKDLTGPLCYAFDCLARIYAEAHPERSLRECYVRVFTHYYPVLEEVMDTKKLEDIRQQALSTIAECLHRAVGGSVLDAMAFEPFMDADALDQFRGVAATARDGLGTCRGTAFGRLVASGRELKKATPKVVGRMLKLGFEPDEILGRLQADAHGEFLTLPRRKGGDEEDEGESAGLAAPRLTVDWNEPDVLRRIKIYGRPLFETVFERCYDEDGAFTVKARMIDYRDPVGPGQRSFTITLQFPAFNAPQLQVGADGHQIVVMPGIPQRRFFRPRLRLQKKRLVMDNLEDVITEALITEIDRLPGLPKRRGQVEEPYMGTPTRRRLEDYLNDAILTVISHLPPSDTEVATRKLGPSDQVQRDEFQVHVSAYDQNGERRPTHIIWELRRELLTQIEATGKFDLLTTRKGEPGTLVTRQGRGDGAAFIERLNPFAECLRAKRRVEVREIKEVLPLHKPIAPSVRRKGATLPKGWLAGMTEAVCLIADLNVNHFATDEGDSVGHDTLIAFESALPRFALKEQVLSAKNEVMKGQMIDRLLEQGIPISKIAVDPIEAQIAGGLIATSYRITVAGPIEDVGKIKAAVGPVKGVMTAIPARAYAVRGNVRREIDLCIPEKTLLGATRWGLDAWLYMECANAGITEIPEELDVRALKEQIRACYAKDDDRLSDVYVEQDGEEYFLGRCMVGALPFFRPSQTSLSTFHVRSRERGIALETHAAIMAGVAPTLDREENQRFAQLVTCFRETKRRCYTHEDAILEGNPTDADAPSAA